MSDPKIVIKKVNDVCRAYLWNVDYCNTKPGLVYCNTFVDLKKRAAWVLETLKFGMWLLLGNGLAY